MASASASLFTLAALLKLTATIRRKVLMVAKKVMKDEEEEEEERGGTSSHLTRGAEADGRAGRRLAFIQSRPRLL